MKRRSKIHVVYSVSYMVLLNTSEPSGGEAPLTLMVALSRQAYIAILDNSKSVLKYISDLS